MNFIAIAKQAKGDKEKEKMIRENQKLRLQI